MNLNALPERMNLFLIKNFFKEGLMIPLNPQTNTFIGKVLFFVFHLWMLEMRSDALLFRILISRSGEIPVLLFTISMGMYTNRD